MDLISNFFSHFVEPDLKTALLVILNLILIESLLSIDNAAVLATMVIDLPGNQRKRALRIGIIFAYIFRGLALFGASYLIKITWLKFAGGAYLIYLFLNFFYKKLSGKKEPEASSEKEKPGLIPGLSNFWSTVIMVELVDMTFSIDNVFAAVAYTHNIYLVYVGVFIGIITMRIVAGYFVKLMNLFPFLDTVAFIIIGILGTRLCAEFACSLLPNNLLCGLMEGEASDFYFSILTVGIFLLPIATSLLCNFPRRKA